MLLYARSPCRVRIAGRPALKIATSFLNKLGTSVRLTPEKGGLASRKDPTFLVVVHRGLGVHIAMEHDGGRQASKYLIHVIFIQISIAAAILGLYFHAASICPHPTVSSALTSFYCLDTATA